MADLYSNSKIGSPFGAASNSRTNGAVAAGAAQSKLAAQSGKTGGEMRFMISNTDLASSAIMDNTLRGSKRSGDLLAQEVKGAENLEMVTDKLAYVFYEEHSPASLGKKLCLSLQNGCLIPEQGSQRLDLTPESRASLPTGNHDLVKSVAMTIKTNYPKPFLVTFKTLPALKEEHFIGNLACCDDEETGASTSAPVKKNATRSVAIVVMPSDLDAQGRYTIKVFERKLTSVMAQFLQKFPNQTADNIRDYVTLIQSKSGKQAEALMHFDPTNTLRQTSCVSLWYNALEAGPDKKTLVDNGSGFAAMSQDLYLQLEARAVDEIRSRLPLGDLTKDFAIEISALPINGIQNQYDLGAFEASFFGASEDERTVNELGHEMSLREVHDKTMFYFEGRICAEYVKLHDGR